MNEMEATDQDGPRNRKTEIEVVKAIGSDRPFSLSGNRSAKPGS